MPLNNPTSGLTITTGTYTGDGTNDRQITVGFVPSMVLLLNYTDGSYRWCTWSTASGISWNNANQINPAATDCKLHSTDGFEVDNANANANTKVYHYWAISS
jgi:hypothetical protein